MVSQYIDIYIYLKVTSPLGHWIIVFCRLSQPSYLAILWLCMTCQLLEGCICIAAVLISTASFTMSTPHTKSKPCLAKATKFSPEGFLDGSILCQRIITDPQFKPSFCLGFGAMPFQLLNGIRKLHVFPRNRVSSKSSNYVIVCMVPVVASTYPYF